MKIDIELGPIEMILMENLDLKNVVERGLSKPRKIRIGQKILYVLDNDPNAELVDVGHFSVGNIGFRHRHAHVADALRAKRRRIDIPSI